MPMICRTCLQDVENGSYFYIDTFDNNHIPNTIPKDVLQLCVPELDLYISEQPGICTECLNMFESFYNFKNKCLASEEKILTYLNKNKISFHGKINLMCVLHDVVEPSVLNNSENVQCNEISQLEGNGEIVLINVPNGLSSEETGFVNNSEEREVSLLSCNECSFVTMEKEKLTNHKCLAISTLDKYKCPYCDYSSSRRYRLSYHINAKHTKASWYDCSRCDYKTTDSNSLRRHQKVVHLVKNEGAPFYSCTFCEFTSGSEVALQRHQVAKHGPIIQQCPVCSYQTKDKSNFRKHLYIHGEKPRKCTKCSYQCISPYQLQRHYKRSHV